MEKRKWRKISISRKEGGGIQMIIKDSTKMKEFKELKEVIHKMIDAVSSKDVLDKIYTFIKYLK